MRALSALLLFGWLSMATGPLMAVEPDEILDDPALEARARALSLDLRCLVCQNQSIDDSNAELAREMRLLVRERLLAGNSDQAVKDYLVSRYGDYVLLDPPVKPSTYLLWFGPLLLVLLAFPLTWLVLRRQVFNRTSLEAGLSQKEARRLASLLSEEPGSRDEGS